MATNLQQGIQLVGQAITLDSEGNLVEAISMYQQALNYLEKAFNEEGDFSRKNQILDKMKEYNERMQLLNSTVQKAQVNNSSFQQTNNFPNTPNTNVSNQNPNNYNQESNLSSPYSSQINNITSPYETTPSNVIKAPYDSPFDSSSSSNQQQSFTSQPFIPSNQQNFSSNQQETPQYNPAPSMDAFNNNSFNSSYQNQSQYGTQPSAPIPTVSKPPDMSKFAPLSNNTIENQNPSNSPPSYEEQFGNRNSISSNSNTNVSMNSNSNVSMNPNFNNNNSQPPSYTQSEPSINQNYNSSLSHQQQEASFNANNNNNNNSFNNNSFNNQQQTSLNRPQSMHNTNIQSQNTIMNFSNQEYNKFIINIQKEHPRNIPNIQIALLIAEEAKKEDRNTQYQDAIDLYTEALERFILVYNKEQNQNIKQTLHNTINSYMERAEKIKQVCKLIPRRVPDENTSSQQEKDIQNPRSSMLNLTPLNQSSNTQNNPRATIHIPQSTPSTFNNQQRTNSLIQDTPGTALSNEQPQTSFTGKPIQITNETKSLLARQRLRLTVNLKNNLVFPGDKVPIHVKVENRSSMVVQFLKVTLRRIEKNQKYDTKGRQVMATDALKIHRQEFYQGSIFPLPAESNYTGELLYTIPHGLHPTNTTQRGIFEREYDLSVQCELSMRKNLSVRFPLVIGKD